MSPAASMSKPTLIRFSESADQWLRAEVKRLGIGRGEYLRRLVDEKRFAIKKEEETR